MNNSKSSLHLRMFTLADSNSTKVCFMENKIIQVTQGEQRGPIVILDQNIRFSINKSDKNHKNQFIQFIVIAFGQQIKIKIQDQQDLQFCVRYIGRYGYGFGLQAIISQFEKVGKGNFATVYKFVSTYNITKAMKMFQKKVLQIPKNKASFYNEIKIMRGLNSSNLASLDCIFQTQKAFYLQIQYFQETLRTYLKRRISQKKQKLIMKNLLHGLKQMKNQNIIHRDIKPENIMVRRKQNREQEFVIIDFGLASKLSELNSIQKICGTPGFMAPQIANMIDKAKAKITVQCDIFSLGVTFFYILTKKKPFSGADNRQMLYKNKKLIIEEHLYYHMSDAEIDLIKKMMQKDPERRITVEQALVHHYFNDQVDDQDQIPEQNCDLDSKLKQIKIMDTSSMSEGIVLLYSLLRLSEVRPVKQQYHRCFIGTGLDEFQNT